MRETLALLLLMVVLPVWTLAQNDTASKKEKAEMGELSLQRFNFSNRRPAVGLFGGMTSYERNDISANLENAIAIGLELGFRRDNSESTTTLSSLFSEGIYFSFHKGATGAPDSLSQMGRSFNALKFGVAARNGYGYKFGSGPQGIIFLHGSSSLSWTVLNVPDDSIARAGGEPLADFGSSVRFGDAWMPAIEFRIAEPVSLQLQYTWSQVFPRHMFWYWLGSGTIEAVADALTVYFVKEIAQSSPVATPIMYFLLRNGVSAAFKALRMDNMNWPFATEAPLNMHTFSIGATIIF
ncbi:MAG: hypothetical protein SGJ05_09100 [bacterium]|nr:hypothetical protein [bacterium]